MQTPSSTWLRSAVRLDQPLTLAFAPAIGYLIAFLDRLGEAVALGVPVDYITISTTDALSRVSVVFVALAALLAVVRIETSLTTHLPAWLHQPLNTLMTWSLNAAVVFVLFWLPRLALAVLLVGLGWSILHAAWSYWRRPKTAVQESKHHQRAGVVDLGAPPPSSASVVEVKAGLALVLLVAGLLFAFTGGNLRAATRDTHLVSQAEGGLVVLAIYGDRAALGSLGPDGVTVGPERKLAVLTEFETPLLWRRTGPLVANPSFVLVPLAPLVSGGR